MKCIEDNCRVNGIDELNKCGNVEFIDESENGMNEKCDYEFEKKITTFVSRDPCINKNRLCDGLIRLKLRSVIKLNVLMTSKMHFFSVWNCIMALVQICILFLIVDCSISNSSDTFKHLFFISAIAGYCNLFVVLEFHINSEA